MSSAWSYSFRAQHVFLTIGTYQAVSTHSDSALVLMHGLGQPPSLAAVPSTLAPTEDSVRSSLELKSFQRTPGGRPLALSLPYGGGLSCNEIARDGACAQLSDWNVSGDLLGTAWHPNHGFAVLFGDTSSITLLRLDTSGVEVQPFGEFYHCRADSAIVEANLTIADNGRVVVLWSERAHAAHDAQVIRLASVGWTTPLATHDPVILHPSSFSLSSSPNPFNASTTLHFSLPQSATASILIYDITGRQVKDIQIPHATVGDNTFNFDARDLPSGVYLISLRSGAQSVTTKVLLLK